MSTLFHLFPILSLALYLSAGISYARDLLMEQRKLGESSGREMLSVGVLLHLLSLLFDELALLFFQTDYSREFRVVPSFPYSFSLMACVLVGTFLLLERRLEISSLGAFVALLAMGILMYSGVLFHFAPEEGLPALQNNAFLLLHISMTILGYVAFGFACGVSIALIVQENLLKSKRFTALGKKLPSIRVLDRLNRNFLVGGFCCLLSGILLGVYFGATTHASLLAESALVLGTLITLAIYTALLFGMLSRGLRGSRAAWLSIAGFCSLLLSFVFVHVVGGGFHVH